MCFSDRKKPMCCIMVMSGLAVICGLVMIAFAFIFTNQDVLKQMEKEDEKIEDGRKLLFIGLVIFSLLTIVAATMGFCAKCCKSWCFNICFGTLLLPVWIVVTVIGAAALFVAVAAEDRVEDECNKLLEKTSQLIDDRFGDQINAELDAATGDIVADLNPGTGSSLSGSDFGGFSGGSGSFADAFIQEAEVCKVYTSLDKVVIDLDIYDQIGINEFMCSSDCPCKDVPTKTDWTSITVLEGRALPCKAWNFAGTFETYKECILSAESVSTISGSGAAFKIFAKKFREQDDFNTIMEWIEFFEEEYNCAGICTPAKFSWSQSIALGLPTKSCINSIKDDLTDSFTGLAAATLTSGILLFFIWIMQYCLWRKF